MKNLRNSWLIVILSAMALLILNSAPARAAENHGATLAWGASASAAACLPSSTPACAGSYNVFEGSGPGLESSTPLNSSPITVLTFTDDGSTMNAYLGTTRCYVVQFQEVVGGTLTLTSPNSNEVCLQFPPAPSAPGTATGQMH